MEEKLSTKESSSIISENLKCALCERKASSLTDLKSHLKICHSKPNLESPRMTKSLKTGNSPLALKDDTQTNSILPRNDLNVDTINLFSCHICDFTAEEESSLLSHVTSKHALAAISEIDPVSESPIEVDTSRKVVPDETDQSQLSCDKCSFTTVSESTLTQHIQTTHTSLKVCIRLADKRIIACELCDYKCVLNIQLQKHKESQHTKPQEEVVTAEVVTAEVVTDDLKSSGYSSEVAIKNLQAFI